MLHCKEAGALSLLSKVIDHSRQQLCVQVNGRGRQDAAYSDKSFLASHQSFLLIGLQHDQPLYQ